jgi:hypothetical protein
MDMSLLEQVVADINNRHPTLGPVRAHEGKRFIELRNKASRTVEEGMTDEEEIMIDGRTACWARIERLTGVVYSHSGKKPICLLSELVADLETYFGKDGIKTKKRSNTFALPNQSKRPRLVGPFRIKRVYEEILNHPDYKSKLTESTRWAFEAGCVGGGSFCSQANNTWSRLIWSHLFENGPPPP